MDDLTLTELYIYTMLKACPEPTLHITEDGNHIYVIVGEGANESLLDIERIDGPLYTTMNGEEINQVIIDYMTALSE